jgi:hypothetical protein
MAEGRRQGSTAQERGTVCASLLTQDVVRYDQRSGQGGSESSKGEKWRSNFGKGLIGGGEGHQVIPGWQRSINTTRTTDHKTSLADH